MASHLAKMHSLGLIDPPQWLPANIMYEVQTGSVAYGCSTDTSDMDVVGFCFPPKDMVFPHLRGEIPGFGRNKKNFEQYQQHHVKWESGRKEYDFTIYSIVKFFQLCLDNNPNMLDVLFVPADCVLKSSKIAEMVRSERKIFLHKGSYHKFKGYAYSQQAKMSRHAETKEMQDIISFEDSFGIDRSTTYAEVELELSNRNIG